MTPCGSGWNMHLPSTVAVALPAARRHPARGATVAAEEIEDAIEGEDAIDESGGEIGITPRLAAHTQGEPDDEELFDGGEEHGSELQPGPEGRDDHQGADTEDHQPPVTDNRLAGGGEFEQAAEEHVVHELGVKGAENGHASDEPEDNQHPLEREANETIEHSHTRSPRPSSFVG